LLTLEITVKTRETSETKYILSGKFAQEQWSTMERSLSTFWRNILY